MINLNRYLVAARRPVAMALVCCAMLAGLQGCAGVVLGGAAVVGTLAATDRRSIGTQADDKAISYKGDQRVYSVIPSGDNVNITSFNRRVLLTGQVYDQSVKERAGREVTAVDGVREVINELTVGPVVGFGTRSNDRLIGSKVRASLLDEKNLYSNSIKVVTEAGVVYLMGRVTPREADLAVEITRGVGGVLKVVKVFEYLSDEEYRALVNTPDSEKKAVRDSQIDH